MCWDALSSTSTAGRLSFVLAFVDLIVMSICLLVNGLKVDNYFSFENHKTNIFDLNVVGLVRSGLLLLLCWHADDVTTHRLNAERRSGFHRSLLSFLIFILPLGSFVFAVYKCASVSVGEAVSKADVAYVLFVASIGMSLVELPVVFLAFIRGKEPNSAGDYNFLGEETPLVGRGSKRRGSSSKLSLPGLMMTNPNASTDTSNTSERAPVTAGMTSQASSQSGPGLEKRDSARARSKKQSKRGLRTTDLVVGISASSAAVASSTALSSSLSLSSSFSRPTLPAFSHTETQEEKNFRQRTQIIMEILETEETYVATLSMIISVFLVPLREAAERAREREREREKGGAEKEREREREREKEREKSAGGAEQSRRLSLTGERERERESEGEQIVIEKAQVKTIFLEIETLYKVNDLLLHDLKKRLATWGPQERVADIFLTILPLMKTYTTYANNFHNAIQTIGKCKKHASFNKFLHECLALPQCRKMWLDDHLITPIQRVPRYVLLLRELAKKTKETHEDYENVTEALRQMEVLGVHINESKKHAERSVMMVTIQRMVKRSPNIVAPSRRFINDFPCTELLVTSGSKVPKEFAEVCDIVVYLFNDLILVAEHTQISGVLGRTTELFRSGDTLRPVTVDSSGQEILHKYKYQKLAMIDDITVVDISEEVNLPHGFLIRYPEGSIYYSAPSKEEKKFFLKSVLEAQGRYVADQEEHGTVLMAKRSLRTKHERDALHSSLQPSLSHEKDAQHASLSNDGERGRVGSVSGSLGGNDSLNDTSEAGSLGGDFEEEEFRLRARERAASVASAAAAASVAEEAEGEDGDVSESARTSMDMDVRLSRDASIQEPTTEEEASRRTSKDVEMDVNSAGAPISADSSFDASSPPAQTASTTL